ncbi:hypothetical protein JI75_06480 [Berryella intestinalis]|uniref:Uncharacterized protein n=1 Tax=Berryella intestinalis TaxID=1531429 RepID=A0A0A8B4B7_9ACTN|nr:hypothetical protein JI75_06480 [Berryella intestinalis]
MVPRTRMAARLGLLTASKLLESAFPAGSFAVCDRGTPALLPFGLKGSKLVGHSHEHKNRPKRRAIPTNAANEYMSRGGTVRDAAAICESPTGQYPHSVPMSKLNAKAMIVMPMVRHDIVTIRRMNRCFGDLLDRVEVGAIRFIYRPLPTRSPH